MAICLVAGLPGAAKAADIDVVPHTDQSIYLSVFGGLSIFEDTDFDGTSVVAAGAARNFDLDYDAGFNVGGALGYRFDSYLWGGLRPRVELEVSYRENDIDNGAFLNNAVAEVFDGDQSAVFLMGNLLFDLPGYLDNALVPYFGGGLGVAFFDSDVSYFPVVAPAAIFQLRDDSEEAFAWQLIAGARYKLTDTTSIFLEGRYFQVVDVDLQRFTPAGTLEANVRDNLDGFVINGGITFELGGLFR